MRDKHLTLGSLFDGSGGFPLAGILSGIEPVWASEVEPFAIRVTTKRLPGVQHFGRGQTGRAGRRAERPVPPGDPHHQGNEGEYA